MPKKSKLNSKSFPKWIIWLLFLPSLLLNFYLFQENKKLGQGIEVMAVLDGDTILLDDKVRLRLRQIDAPELDFCGGQEAKELLEKLIKGKRVVLQEYILDQRSRPLALVYAEGVLVNQKMIESGWARYHHDQTEKTDQLKSAGAKAKEEKRGVYSSLCWQIENLENPNCLIKGNIDKNKYVDNKKYYFPGCAQYKFTIVEKDLGEDWFCTEEEAQKAGFTKAKSCYDRSY